MLNQLKPYGDRTRDRITDDILEAKQKRRKWEKKTRKSGATWIRQEFKESCELVKNMISRAKVDHYVNHTIIRAAFVCVFVPYLLRGPLTDLRQTW